MGKVVNGTSIPWHTFSEINILATYIKAIYTLKSRSLVKARLQSGFTLMLVDDLGEEHAGWLGSEDHCLREDDEVKHRKAGGELSQADDSERQEQVHNHSMILIVLSS